MVGRVTEIASHDVIFLEEDFPKRGEINGDFRLYEMEDPEASGSARKIDSAPIEQDGMGYHTPPEDSRSEKLLDFDPMEQDHEQSQPRHSNNEKVPVVDLRLRGKPS